MNTENKEISLPENIKEEIRKNIAELKDILKDDKEFADSLVLYLCEVGQDHILPRILPEHVVGEVFEYYSDVIKKCQQDYKPFPTEVTRLQRIVGFLAHLGVGNGQLIYDVVGEINADNYDIIVNKIKTLAELCVKEIGSQYNPELSYSYNIDPIIREAYRVECTGEDSDPEAI